MLAAGWSSIPCSRLFKSRSHNSSWVSLEKSASTAPALVPVATNGAVAPGDHAKVAVRGISRSLTILGCGYTAQRMGKPESFEEVENGRTCLDHSQFLIDWGK